jgi:hypothetical protein
MPEIPRLIMRGEKEGERGRGRGGEGEAERGEAERKGGRSGATHQAAILDLLDLELCEGVGVVSQAQGVEALTGVQLVQALAGGAAVYSVTLDVGHQQHLHDNVHLDKAGDALGEEQKEV